MKANRFQSLGLAAAALAALVLGGCATNKSYDYTAYKEARPASILVLPPVNNSPDIAATYSMMSHATAPLSESGYYVFPVTLVAETFKQNGMTSPEDIQAIPAKKLREIFGADAGLYVTVKQYGTSYSVIASETRVTAEATLVDLRTGTKLWAGSATASSAEGKSNSGGLIGMLIDAAVRQVLETINSQGHITAAIMSDRLLSAGRPNGILYGPRSPMYLKDGVPAM